MTAPLIEVRDLWVEVVPRGRREPVAVVRGANLELPRQAITGVVGASGSGKTVLFRSILGIARLRPGVVRGQVWLRLDENQDPILLRGFGEGKSLAPPARGWAGYVFQHPELSLDPFATVGSQVAASVRRVHRGLSSAEIVQRTERWLERVQLDDPDHVARLRNHELSGGMAQRVALAVAAAAEPRFLVADEPTSGLDWSSRRGMVELLGRLCKEEGVTLVLVSHDFQVVEHLADHLAVMYRGEIVESGPRTRFFDGEPGLHPYTGDLQARSSELTTGLSLRTIVLNTEQPSEGGCRYAHKCSTLHNDEDWTGGESCRSTSPPDMTLPGGHRVRCFAATEGGTR